MHSAASSGVSSPAEHASVLHPALPASLSGIDPTVFLHSSSRSSFIPPIWYTPDRNFPYDNRSVPLFPDS